VRDRPNSSSLQVCDQVCNPDSVMEFGLYLHFWRLVGFVDNILLTGCGRGGWFVVRSLSDADEYNALAPVSVFSVDFCLVFHRLKSKTPGSGDGGAGASCGTSVVS